MGSLVGISSLKSFTGAESIKNSTYRHQTDNRRDFAKQLYRAAVSSFRTEAFQPDCT